MTRWKQSFLLLIYGLVCIGLDQWTKAMIQQHLALGERIVLIKQFLYITYVQNTGAGFSLFAGFGLPFFTVITLVACAALAVYLYQAKEFGLRFLLTTILAGALGNFIDRLLFGYVRDFIGVYIFGWAFPVFNGADILITCGFACLALWMIVQERREKQAWNKKQS